MNVLENGKYIQKKYVDKYKIMQCILKHFLQHVICKT